MPGYCAIDFGTSNSSVAVPSADDTTTLVPLESGLPTMPTAVFYFTDAEEAQHAAGVHHPQGALPRAYGRSAIAAYVDGHAGRLMRSLKSILGSDLVDQATDLGDGHSVRYLDVVTAYLRHLRSQGEAACGQTLDKVVLGRPVFFVDDDPVRDARAQSTLLAAAQAAGFSEVQFQFEPIAAAFDYERRVTEEQLVLVCDIGGGTSDFSVVRVGPAQRQRLDRRSDILANHGVHVAGTDFDRQIELAAVLPHVGYGSHGPARSGARPVPSNIYHDLATWHLINTCYRPQRVAQWRSMADWFADAELHRRLMRVLDLHLGHDLASRSEAAKIEAAQGIAARVDLSRLAPDLCAVVTENVALFAIARELDGIVDAARHTVRKAGLQPQDIDALYFTGGSTGLLPLTRQLAQAFPDAQAVHGDRLASVATGLGVHAANLFSYKFEGS